MIYRSYACFLRLFGRRKGFLEIGFLKKREYNQTKKEY